MQESNDAGKAARISGRDIALIRQSRMKSKYNELTAEERSAYESVHDSLSVLGTAVRKKLAAYGAYGMKLTSGFSIRAGVRGYLPKDLWFAVYNQLNRIASVGNPQLFMIASHRGIEYGFAASIHPARFSDRAVQERVRNGHLEFSRPCRTPTPSVPHSYKRSWQMAGISEGERVCVRTPKNFLVSMLGFLS